MADPDPSGATTDRFRAVARTALDVLLEADPAEATALGDHRFDGRLADVRPATVERTMQDLADAIGALDDLDDTQLDVADAADHDLLRTRLTGALWSLGELRAHTWDPLVTLPGRAVYSLLARDTGAPQERLRALVGRLSAVPGSLAAARDRLGPMPRVHVQTAAAQARGVLPLLDAPVQALLERAGGGLATEVDQARAAAAAALVEHARWLDGQVGSADRDPRLGERAFAATLWYTLDTPLQPDALLDRAESDLMAVEAQIAEVAARLAPRLGVAVAAEDQVRAVLDALAASAPVDDASVLARCADHLGDLTALVQQQALVSVPQDAVEIIEMPEIDRGVAVAYCDPPGPLEADGPTGPPPTFFAVSPTPHGWSAEQVASFYREYNDHMLRDLTVHEAMPGHVLQLAHSRRYVGSTAVRAALSSGTFVEGWAVYAEQLVAAAVQADDPDGVPALALRMQQLKMLLRCTINAVLDVRVHCRGMTEAEAMALMTRRGHQEVGEATGKWRRALLTSAQLSTYYVGRVEVAALAADLAASRPGASVRAVHDELLAHGSPSPRLLRDLLSLV